MVVTSCFLLLVIFSSSRQVDSTSSKRFNVLYEEGLTAYGAEQWETAVDLIQEAIHQYNEEKEKLLGCVRKCRDQRTADNSLFTPSGELAETELQLAHVSNCIQNCRETVFARDGVPFDVMDTFESRLPYNFLQFSLTKVI